MGFFYYVGQGGEMNIGSYHKTGTNLIGRIFRNYNETHKEAVFKFFWNFYRAPRSEKAIVIIRHPMEVIMSSVRYHQTSKEGWLHKHHDWLEGEYAGKTYAENIKSLSVDKKIVFEMNHVSFHTVNHMLHDFTHRSNTFFFKIEDLYDESNVKPLSRKMSLFSGLNPESLEKSIKSAASVKWNATTDDLRHTYKDHFKESHYDLFYRLFPPTTLEILGYSQ